MILAKKSLRMRSTKRLLMVTTNLDGLLVWGITDDSANLPNFPFAKHFHYIARVALLVSSKQPKSIGDVLQSLYQETIYLI